MLPSNPEDCWRTTNDWHNDCKTPLVSEDRVFASGVTVMFVFDSFTIGGILTTLVLTVVVIYAAATGPVNWRPHLRPPAKR